jgi:Ca2+-binding EF-hand superfamily protein
VQTADGRDAFVKLRGPWGEGWLFISAEDGTALLREIDDDLVANSNADLIAGITRDDILHCFRAICAITPDLSLEVNRVARKSIEYVLPSGWSQRKLDKFFADFHFDDGESISDESIGLAEFARMYSAIQENWRFAGVWAQFQDVDDNGDGMLQVDELRRVVPPGSNKNEVNAWMKRFDQDQKCYISLADFVAIDHAVLQDKLHLALGTAFVLCVYFTHSRVTKALLSVFSTENIEGKNYLKFEVGTLASTKEHIAMMAISVVYLFFFSFSIPIVAFYAMYYSRHNLKDRKFATIGGFLTDGYRSEVSWFWEFIVLMRKLVILSISLYVSEPFLQSFSAVVALVLALSLQLYFQPYELFVLNMLETASLASVLMTQLGGILMWYKSLPGMTDNLALYQT